MTENNTRSQKLFDWPSVTGGFFAKALASLPLMVLPWCAMMLCVLIMCPEMYGLERPLFIAALPGLAIWVVVSSLAVVRTRAPWSSRLRGFLLVYLMASGVLKGVWMAPRALAREEGLLFCIAVFAVLAIVGAANLGRYRFSEVAGLAGPDFRPRRPKE